MNDLTRRVVEQAVRNHRAKALNDSTEFAWIVEDEYWLEIMSEFGWKIKKRAIDLWHQFHPEHFDPNGFLMYYDIELSDIATRAITRRVENDPKYRLDDYGDYHIQLADKLRRKARAKVTENQLELF